MPDLVRHLSEKSGRDSGFNPYGLPQNDSKKSGRDTGSEAGMTEKKAGMIEKKGSCHAGFSPASTGMKIKNGME